jgi:hypothetical protein
VVRPPVLSERLLSPRREPEPLLGLKILTVPSSGTLCSFIGVAPAWTPGEPYVADCYCHHYYSRFGNARHAPPQWTGHCGIYAVTAPEYLSGTSGRRVLAAVLLSGRVLQHETGYRAQRATLAALLAGFSFSGSSYGWLAGVELGMLAATYEIPVVPWEEWQTVPRYLPERTTIP